MDSHLKEVHRDVILSTFDSYLWVKLLAKARHKYEVSLYIDWEVADKNLFRTKKNIYVQFLNAF
jgi:hypothetical protein